MEEYLYLVVGAIWLIVSAIRGKNKKNKSKNKSRPKRTPTKSSGDNIREMLEEFLGGAVGTPSVEKVPDAKARVEEKPDDSAFSNFQPLSSQIKGPGRRAKKAETIEVEEIGHSEWDDFNVRQAVIFSEIMKRPEF